MTVAAWSLPELTEEDRLSLARLAEEQQVDEGIPFIRQGEHPHALFLLLDGTASVLADRHGRQVEISQVRAGAILGEMSLVSGDPASASVVSLTPCQIARVPAEALRDHGETDPGFSARLYQGLARVIGRRLQQMNRTQSDVRAGAAFNPVSWPDTLASIRLVILPRELLHWIARYSAVGHRGMFLWKWCWRGLQETELTCVPAERREDLRITKMLAILLNCLLDDLADYAGQEEQFQEALTLLTPHSSLRSGEDPPRVSDLYLRLVRDIWYEIGERTRALPGWATYAPLWDFDYRQVFNAMQYASLTRRYPGLDNLTENRAYLGHNINMIVFAMLDLMASGVVPGELGCVREVVHHAQSWAEIGNHLATWKREVPERDFTSRVFAQALDAEVLTREELDTLPPEEIQSRVELSQVEGLLMAECRLHRDRMIAVASRCRSVDLETYAKGVETFFGMNLAARGHI